ncbi:MAG: 50S ribosomal protein L25, partial [Chloroflexota bacterium]
MNNTVELAAEWRTVHGKQAKRLRKKGLIPAVLYGHGPSVSLQVNAEAVKDILRRRGRTTLLNLKMLGGETATAVIKQLQFDPVRGDLIHLDFMRVLQREKLKQKVPLRFVGEAPVAETHDVTIIKPLDAVTVETYPQDIPSAVEVDLARLTEPNSTVRVSDLEPGPRVRILDQPEEVVASVSISKREEIQEL